jgi:hypothetical protein
MLNRYLDVYDMIEDGDGEDLEGAGENFDCTDVPGLMNLRIPEKNMIDEGKKSKISNWCLKFSLDNADNTDLPTHGCPQCSKQVFIVKIALTLPRLL